MNTFNAYRNDFALLFAAYYKELLDKEKMIQFYRTNLHKLILIWAYD